jgi:hypothetical protein
MYPLGVGHLLRPNIGPVELADVAIPSRTSSNWNKVELLEVGRRGAGLQHAIARPIISISRCRAADTERGQTVCIIVNICCGRAIHRLLCDVAVIVVCESRR